MNCWLWFDTNILSKKLPFQSSLSTKWNFGFQKYLINSGSFTTLLCKFNYYLELNFKGFLHYAKNLKCNSFSLKIKIKYLHSSNNPASSYPNRWQIPVEIPSCLSFSDDDNSSDYSIIIKSGLFYSGSPPLVFLLKCEWANHLFCLCCRMPGLLRCDIKRATAFVGGLRKLASHLSARRWDYLIICWWSFDKDANV